MSSRESPRYVRFGNLPRTGRSMDLRGVRMLEGVCVYEGRLDERRGFVIDASQLNEKMGIPGLAAVAATDRRAYFVEGEEVGRGTDGEPLLRVESIWPVPRETDITCISADLQEALWLWSKGPRDGSGEKHLGARLKDKDSPYLPEGYDPIPGVVAMTRHDGRGGKPADKEKRRRQKQARKKQRAKKR